METFGGLDFRVRMSIMKGGYKRKINLETKGVFFRGFLEEERNPS